MRTTLFNSLIFAALSSFTGFAYSAPATTPAGAVSSAQSMVASTPGAKVDLNGADSETIQRELAGVGEAKAKAIVAYRDINGPFASVDELLEVKGIGKAILDRNRGKLEAN
ncbi:hypothetical protein PS645_04032 [Pseudomonas fluorescens]|uniref:Competence protein ComEA n=1 Tax=Pseudomonas fluorescens TaxID=294 RepID=A0A5E6VC39_PSEFL|nr:helix-hairpin-helix domain-containing protein [Pseudomonas fluorescens]VVN15692.1 hypothetical protein PS645_04032 [Pseudomonas fluorescens]